MGRSGLPGWSRTSSCCCPGISSGPQLLAEAGTPERHNNNKGARLLTWLSSAPLGQGNTAQNAIPSPGSPSWHRSLSHGAGKAGCRYPGVGLRQHQALLPSWAEPMQVASPWEVHPGALRAPRLRQHRGPGAGGLEPGRTLGSQARRSRGGAAIPAWKAPGARQCRGSWADGGGCQEQAMASLQPHLPVHCWGAWGWAQHLTCTLMWAVAVARSLEPSRLTAWISRVYSGTACSERQCHPQMGGESQTGHAGG